MPKNSSRNKSSKRRKERFLYAEPLKRLFGRTLPVGIPLVFFGFFFFFLSKATFHFLTHSPYFAIDTVEASSRFREFAFKDASLMGSYLSQNIFTVDLEGLKEELSRKHPELLESSVRRNFPNQLQIQVTPRLPVAQLGPEGYWLLDNEGILLPKTHALTGKKLPVLVGIRESLGPSSVGRSLRGRGAANALSFLSSLNALPELEPYVSVIDVSDEEHLSFTTPEGLEVRVGSGDFGEKLEEFDRTRVTLGDRIREIKYVDLRFDEVVIGSR